MIGLMTCVPLPAATGLSTYGGLDTGTFQTIAFWSAAGSLFWSLCGAAGAARNHPDPPPSQHRRFAGFAHVVALLTGVTAGAIGLFMLASRLTDLARELATALPSTAYHDYSLSTAGVGMLGLLFASCATGFITTGNRKLAACLVWIGAAFALWLCLLLPAHRYTANGGMERTGLSVAIIAALSSVVAVSVLISEFAQRRAERGFSERVADDDSPLPLHWPGFRLSCGAISMAVFLLVCYCLTVPTNLVSGGYRTSMLLSAASATACAASLHLLVKRKWNSNLADAGMGLFSLALCGGCVALLPPEPALLEERFPWIFSALIVGLTLSTALWTHLEHSRFLRGGRPLTPSSGKVASGGHTEPEPAPVPQASLGEGSGRFAFLTATLAIVISAVMAVWPRLPAIATMDDSIDRFVAGLGANVLLLLVLLRASRRLRRSTFSLLAVFAIASIACFVAVRMLPFANQVN